jgi:hypothetical protein
MSAAHPETNSVAIRPWLPDLGEHAGEIDALSLSPSQGFGTNARKEFPHKQY